MPKYNGLERRIDPQGRLSLDVHAGRALNRFRPPHNEDIKMAGLRESGEARAVFQRRVADLLDKADGKPSLEQRRLMELVNMQYADEVSLTRDFELVSGRDLAPPSAEHVRALFLERFSPEQVAAFFKLAKHPHLQLEPLISFTKCASALDTHKVMKNQIVTYLHPRLHEKWTKQDKSAGMGDTVSGWRVGVLDTVPELDDDPELQGLSFGQQVMKNGAKFRRLGMRSPHPRRYLLAQMRALRRKEPLDRENWSALHYGYGGMAGGGWGSVRVVFNERDADRQHNHARFRPEMVLDVPRVSSTV